MSTDPKPFNKAQYLTILGHYTSEAGGKNDHRFLLNFPWTASSFCSVFAVFICLLVFWHSHKLLKIRTRPTENGFAVFSFTQQEDVESMWDFVIACSLVVVFKDSVCFSPLLQKDLYRNWGTKGWRTGL